MSGFDEVRTNDFEVAHEPQQLALLLINSIDDHAHLRDARVGFIFRDHEVTNGHKVVAASMHLPRLSGSAAKHWGAFCRWSVTGLLGFEPDFVCFVDRCLWKGLSEDEKLALIDHELTHAIQLEDEDGNPRFNQVTFEPIWGIKPHDVEEFTSVIQRRGCWNEDLRTFARAVIDSLATHGLPEELPEEAPG